MLNLSNDRFSGERVFLFNSLDISLHGRPLWEDLPNCRVPLLIIHGEKDTKFKKIAQSMMNTLCSDLRSNHEKGNTHEVVEIPNCGHAAHLENPLPVIAALKQFITRL